jgi:phage terminase large subunit GpA-like protein
VGWRDDRFEAAQIEWLAQQFESLTTELEFVKPSRWAEERRYLPPSVSPMPGFYSFDVTPYLREILDCVAVDSPVREVALMKGVQIGATSGVLENVIGYYIDHVKTAPMMLVTADLDLAQLRLDSYITPMLQHSGLLHLIQSNDESNPRKTGRTIKKIEWVGGGFLVPFGAQNANKLRSTSIQVLLNDEVDGWPDTVGKDGDPRKLVQDRTAAFESSRKILDVSTPTLKGMSKIETLFKRGDQRYYFVRCLRCEEPQRLRWSRTNNETGEITGIVWDLDAGGRLIIDSVRYTCKECAHPHTENDKTRLFEPSNAFWGPTAEPVAAHIRSYHLSALYSPPGMQSWAECVQKYLEAWDIQKAVVRDFAKYQVFYNNVLGETFTPPGERIKFEAVSAHRRQYESGQIPNKFAARFCGSRVLVLTCSVDVHKDALKVSIFGWAKHRRALLIEYFTLEGDTERLDNPDTWVALQGVIEDSVYVGDDGKSYRIELTLIDSGYLTDQVYEFCQQYDTGVHPVKGRSISQNASRVVEFSEFTTKHGTNAVTLTVDLFKDKWAPVLKRKWDGVGQQPAPFFNAPSDISDAQLRELTVETKVARKEKSTGKLLGYEWHRPSGAANELWDLLIYNNAALELLAWSLSKQAELESTNWEMFWDACEQGLYFREV